MRFGIFIKKDLYGTTLSVRFGPYKKIHIVIIIIIIVDSTGPGVRFFSGYNYVLEITRSGVGAIQSVTKIGKNFLCIDSEFL